MSILPIIKFPHPVLRTPSAPIKSVNHEMRALAKSMLEAMRAANGVGLAAPQVARALRLIVADDGKSPPLVLFNPRIVSVSSDTAVREEGCLSMPGIAAPVCRPARISVAALDLHGRECTIEAEELLAACLQHEIDHLDGILFVDRLSRLKKERLLIKYQKLFAPRESVS